MKDKSRIGKRDSGTKRRRLVGKTELLRDWDPRSYVTIWKEMVSGKYPRSIKLGDKSRGWWSDELEAYYAKLPRTRLKGDTPEDEAA